MQNPADQDPFTLMQAAAQHVLGGVPEVELEWWVDPVDTDGSPQRRLTITMRSADRWSAINAAQAQAWVERGQHPPGGDDTATWVPDTPEGFG